MRLVLVEDPKCFPISLSEAKNHLNVDVTSTNEDMLIDMLIRSATMDAQSKTGRVFVDSTWEWAPGEITTETEFPIIPVTNVVVHDNKAEYPFSVIPPDAFKLVLPALDPQGKPLIGSLSPLSGFPKDPRIILQVGYQIKEVYSPVVPTNAPEVVIDSTGYGVDKMTLVFNRVVKGYAEPSNFSVQLDGNMAPVDSVNISDGVVNLAFNSGLLVEGSSILISFIGGFIEDDFGMFVKPFYDALFPKVVLPKDPVKPETGDTMVTYASLAPEPIKQWIMVRVGTMYQQRSEIALRAGKSDDAMFPHKFIDSLLDPYVIWRMG